jgi:hypothetical protein
MIAPLFTETGIMPLRVRRLLLVLSQALRKEDIGEDNDVDRDRTESDGGWQLPAEWEEGAVA